MMLRRLLTTASFVGAATAAGNVAMIAQHPAADVVQLRFAVLVATTANSMLLAIGLYAINFWFAKVEQQLGALDERVEQRLDAIDKDVARVDAKLGLLEGIEAGG